MRKSLNCRLNCNNCYYLTLSHSFLSSKTMHHLRKLLDKEGFNVILSENIAADSYYQMQNLKVRNYWY